MLLLSRIHARWAATGDADEAIARGAASTARLITARRCLKEDA